ncbi:MAG: YbaB/EbfC family nucleoid-associated protein [Stackebrandtia sp.]
MPEQKPINAFQAAMAQARQRALSAVMTTASPDGSVEVDVTGERTVGALRIDADAYREHTEDSLADEIVAAYNSGMDEMFTAQLRIFEESVGEMRGGLR